MDFPLSVWMMALVIALVATSAWWWIERPRMRYAVGLFSILIVVWWLAFAMRRNK